MKKKKMISFILAFCILDATCFASGLTVVSDSASIQSGTASYSVNFQNDSGEEVTPVSVIAHYQNGKLNDFKLEKSKNGSIVSGNTEKITAEISVNPDENTRIVAFSLNNINDCIPISYKKLYNPGSSENRISDIHINGVNNANISIDNKKNLITISLPLYNKADGTKYDITGVETELILDSAASAKINGTDVYFLGEGNKKEAYVDFSASPMFEVIAENGDKRIYHTKIYRHIDLDFEDSLINGAMFKNGAIVPAVFDDNSGSVIEDEQSVIPSDGMGKYVKFISGAGSDAYAEYQQYSKAYKKEVQDKYGEESTAMYIEKTKQGPVVANVYSLRLEIGSLRSLPTFPKELSFSYDIKYEDVNGDYRNEPSVSGFDAQGSKLYYRVTASDAYPFSNSYITINNKKNADSNNVTEWNSVKLDFTVDEKNIIHSKANINGQLFSVANDTNLLGGTWTANQTAAFSLGLSAMRCIAIYVDNIFLQYLVSDNTLEEEKQTDNEITSQKKNELVFDAKISRDGKVTLEGTGNAGYAFATAFKYDKNKNIYEQIFDKSTTIAVDAVKTDNDGNFVFNWVLTETSESNDYAFVVGNTDNNQEISQRKCVLYYAKQDEYDSALSAVNSANATNIDDALQINSKTLQLESILDNAVYKKYADDISKIILAEKQADYVSHEEVYSAIESAIDVCVFVKSNASNLGSNVSKFGTKFDLDLSEYLANKENVDKCFETVSEEYCNNNNVTSQNVKEVLNTAIALAKVNGAKKETVIEIIINNASKLSNFDITKIPANNKKRADLAEQIYPFDSTYGTVAELFKAIDDALVVINTPAPIPNNGGTSSGGGAVSKPSGSVMPVQNLTGSTIIDNYGQSDGVSFRDVDNTSWAKKYIESLAWIGVISGREDGKFYPNDTVKREEFIKMLVSALKLPVKSPENKEWYYGYMQAAIENGLIFGYPDGSYGVGNEISRQDVAVMVARTIETDVTETAQTESFKDGNAISDYAKEAVIKCRQSGIICGTDEGNFLPQSFLTRAEAAKIIYSLITK